MNNIDLGNVLWRFLIETICLQPRPSRVCHKGRQKKGNVFLIFTRGKKESDCNGPLEISPLNFASGAGVN